MIFELMYAAIGTNTGLSHLFAKAKRFAVWFGLENAPVKKGFSTSKMCRGGKKIIGRLHSKINTVRFDKMGV